MANHEFDMLEIRLAELEDVVHRFVIVEAELTNQGKRKPAYLTEELAKGDVDTAPSVPLVPGGTVPAGMVRVLPPPVSWGSS